MAKKANVLQEADKLTSNTRQQTYGHPADDFERIATMWSMRLGVEVTARDVAWCMIAVKMSRDVEAPKRDNLVDIAGYARTAEMLDEVS